jgi:beta-fructofuranosidase
MRIPHIRSEYIPVYRPRPAVFSGPDSPSFQAGKLYEQWVPNDFAVIRGEDGWHILGITHPLPPGLTACGYDPATVHEAEWQLFHAVSATPNLRDSLTAGGFAQRDMALCPRDRPGEPKEIHAPIIWRVGSEYVMLYGPDPFRIAVSRDLYRWSPRGEVFGNGYGRDPNILYRDGVYHAVYLSRGGLCMRDSADMRNYGKERRILAMPEGTEAESPILKYIGGYYYLLYCIFNPNDLVNGAYDYRTFVHAARTIEALEGSQPVAQLDAHAPELFQGEDGTWYIGSAEWPTRGISIAELEWK